MSDYPLGRLGLRVRPLEVRPFAEVAERVVEFEELGWPAFWITETVGREAFSFATALLGATRRLVVSIGCASIWGRDALTASAAQRTITEALGDRLVVALGVSHHTVTEQARGHRYVAPYTAMRHFLDAIDAAPYQSAAPATPQRRLLAALGPRMLELSGTRADGAHPYLTTAARTAQAREILGPGPVLAPEQLVMLDTDAARARALARATLGRYLTLPNYLANLTRMGFAEADLRAGGSDRLVDALVAWGDEDTVCRRVQEHLTADGFDLHEIRRLSAALLAPV
jgi:probable F420-dependent oxidoreductase